MALIELKDNSFDEFIKNNSLVLVDFWAEWCKYCIKLEPTLESISKKNSNLNILKINIEEHPSIAENFQVRSIPHLKLFKNGKEIDIEINEREEKELDNLIKKYI